MPPIAGGYIAGAINATIQGGLAHPQNFNNGTIEAPAIILDGKVPYLIQEMGVGPETGQVRRIVSVAAHSWKKCTEFRIRAVQS